MKFKALSVLTIAGLLTGAVHAAPIQNGGFELGTGPGPDNATFWDWTPNANGMRVTSLDNSTPTALISPAFGSYFGYAENGAGTQASGEISQFGAQVPVGNPILTFWWRFFTNETPSTGFNDRFTVRIDGSITLSATVADVDTTTMITTDGPLLTPSGAPGQNQSFARYTEDWALYSLNASALAGEFVTITFRIQDAGASHNQSSGFAIDNVEIPEPASLSLLGLGGLLLVRRRRA